MKTISLKFPNIEIAQKLLYSEYIDEAGVKCFVHRFENVADCEGSGLPVFRTEINGCEVLIRNPDGSYCADMAGYETVPDSLGEYVITPDPKYRKHKFLGE